MPRQVAIITGASGGIGRACAQALASSCNVALQFNRKRTPIDEIIAEVQKTPGQRADGFQADLSQPGSAEKLIDDVAKNFGPPTMLIHAAGHILEKPLSFIKPEEWDALMEVHAVSALALSRAMMRYLRKSEHGRLVFIGSLAGVIGLGNAAAYAASKGALQGLCKSLALEVARWKTTVNVIAPGYVETEMTAAQEEERKNSLREAIPLGRYAKAEEIAGLAAFLCSPNAGYITGQVIVADGGMSLG